jgi:hypothetical protein
MVAQKREAEQQEQQEQKQQPAPAPQPDNQRPGQGQIEGNQNPALTMPGLGGSTFQPQQVNLGNYQSKLDASIADLLLRDNDPGGL